MQAGTLALGGLAIGVLLAWWMGASMASYVYQVAPANPLILGGSALLVVAVALGATLPSRDAPRRQNRRACCGPDRFLWIVARCALMIWLENELASGFWRRRNRAIFAEPTLRAADGK